MPSWLTEQFDGEYDRDQAHADVIMHLQRRAPCELTRDEFIALFSLENPYLIREALSYLNISAAQRLDMLSLLYRCAFTDRVTFATFLPQVVKDYNFRPLCADDPCAWVYFYTYKGDKYINSGQTPAFGYNRPFYRDLDKRCSELLTVPPQEARKIIRHAAMEAPRDIILYRGQHNDATQRESDQLVSFSTKQEIANRSDFMGKVDAGVLYKYYVPKGTPIIIVDDRDDNIIIRNYFGSPNEHEIIMDGATVNGLRHDIMTPASQQLC